MATSRKSPFRPSIRLSPVHSRDNSRSTSPERNPGSSYSKIDPLLSNLSPESTLQALTSTEAIPSSESFSLDSLSQSISQVSPAERALGIRAAIAAQDLKIWYKEVQSWTWPTHNEAKDGKGFVPPTQPYVAGAASVPSLLLPPGSGEVEYYGSLPADVVEKYEKRIEEIRDGMDNLNVEELKEHVLNAHIPSRSRPSSSTSTVSVPPPLSYVQLSDFTAVVTATILRALPFLSRLSALLSTWDVRLLVLRQVPGLLRELKIIRSALDSSFDALRISSSPKPSDHLFSRSCLREEHVKLESAVVSVGRRMDRVLDVLEGRQDSLPESWIDDLEKVESDFAEWVVEAEKYQLRADWLRAKEEAKAAAAAAACEASKAQLEQTSQESMLDLAQAGTVTETSCIQQPAYTETIEEEPQPEVGAPAVSNAEQRQPNVKDSTPSSMGDQTLPTLSRLQIISNVPRAFEKSGVNDAEQGSASRSNVVIAEDLETPTQASFFARTSIIPSMGTPQLSPSRIPLPGTPDIKDKENIPPELVEPPASSSPARGVSKAVALKEHDVDEDPFVQRPTSSGTIEVNVNPIEFPKSSPKTKYHPTSYDGASDSRDEELEGDMNALDVLYSPDPSHAKNSSACSTDSMAKLVSEKPEYQVSFHAPKEMIASEPRTLPVEACKNPGLFAQHQFIQSENLKPATSDREPVNVKSQPTGKSTSQQPSSARKPLQSPIKLGKIRPGKLHLDKKSQIPRPRRPSTGSVGSLLSDNSSLTSSTDAPEPQTGSSGDHLTPSRPDFPTSQTTKSHGARLLRKDRLLHLENRKSSSHSSFQPNRSVSLPLERFINEELAFELVTGEAPDMVQLESTAKDPVSAKFPPNGPSTPRTQVPLRSSGRRPALSRGRSASDLKASTQKARTITPDLKPYGQNTAQRAVQHQEQPKSARLLKRLTAHPSLESLGVRKHELSYVEEDDSEMTDIGSRASSPNRLSGKPRDRLDEKINSILNTIPGRIHLVDPNNEADTSSSSSSMDRKMRERCLSESPHGPSSRSMTPAPGLTLMSASRRRSSYAHKTEDSCVKLYHLHHGGQSAPTRLFVRTVGEEGKRVMVRVGGGWADLGEYLREYVIHHGRRKVAETPRVEVQGFAPRTSPGYSPSNTLQPGAPTHIKSGRATPSRPPSALSARPPSSLTVRKARRSSNASDLSTMAPRSVTTGALSSFTSPPTAAVGNRRLSMSSGYSVGDLHAHSPANTTSGHSDSQATPLGLAGPKPRSRQISMSPEGEAWVEDVLQQTRRSSSVNPPPFSLNMAPENGVPEAQDAHDHVHSLPKIRSFGDIGSAGTSRRIVLKGLNGRR
ncbi:uncharacterized protein N7477_004603 [Penicillium maclennaniae]|uniref:uncharacterized protein n=1 Tax=Penicillium maclennaniae TaxID=1343394 RepID=UPI0025423A66|nr:uncharacterized protein N7477_004603 [Penicillium maclennaniae]KAJ5674669.1 hypothetical protein N7477_004603 [Penicillium maclennaniae]